MDGTNGSTIVTTTDTTAATAPTKSVLRPSALRVANQTAADTTQDAPKATAKGSAFVSLSKEELILRPVTRGTAISTAGVDSNGQNESAFVFGHNLSNRAVFMPNNDQKDNNNKHDNVLDTKHSISGHSETVGDEADHNKTGGDSSSISTDIPKSSTSISTAITITTTSTTSAKDKPSVITGEEGDHNVMSMHCRLYAWQTNTWLERGRGCLRLNDLTSAADGKQCSRLVMRTSGTLRVILNTGLVSGMRFDETGDRGLRFTNIDGIYLIKGAVKDIKQLNTAVNDRLRRLCKRVDTEGDDWPADDGNDDQRPPKHKRTASDSPESYDDESNDD